MSPRRGVKLCSFGCPRPKVRAAAWTLHTARPRPRHSWTEFGSAKAAGLGGGGELRCRGSRGKRNEKGNNSGGRGGPQASQSPPTLLNKPGTEPPPLESGHHPKGRAGSCGLCEFGPKLHKVGLLRGRGGVLPYTETSSCFQKLLKGAGGPSRPPAGSGAPPWLRLLRARGSAVRAGAAAPVSAARRPASRADPLSHPHPPGPAVVGLSRQPGKRPGTGVSPPHQARPQVGSPAPSPPVGCRELPLRRGSSQTGPPGDRRPDVGLTSLPQTASRSGGRQGAPRDSGCLTADPAFPLFLQ